MKNKIFTIAALAALTSITFMGYGATKEKLSYPQVATGQTKSYDADGAIVTNLKPGNPLYGQDANYLAGAPMSYKNNGDGTISDLNTGLMWQMIPVDQGFSWYQARDYCENLELAGYDDWRLPSAKELFSISDFGTGWPYINREYFGLIDGDRVGKDEQYWTSHLYIGVIGSGSSQGAFGVNHATGHIKAYGAGTEGGQNGRPQRQSGQGSDSTGRSRVSQENRPQRQSADSTSRPQMSQANRPQRQSADSTSRPQMSQANRSQGQSGQRQGASGSPGSRGQKYVRAVRGEAYGVNAFIENGDGTISDKATGLMWTQSDSKEGMDWVAALKYAESSSFAGYDDWRLPNVKELQGILNYNYSPNAKDPAHFGAAIDPIFSCTEIVSEKGDRDFPYFWTGTSALFQRGKPYYYAWYVAFGQAVDPNGADSHGAGAVRFDTKHEGGPLGEDKGRIFNYVRLVRNID